jgi:sugar phosphate isomerase/epimerase
MQLRRRDFVASAAAAAAGMCAMEHAAVAAQGERPKAPVTPKRQAVLKLSVQEGIVPGRSLKEKLDKMEKWGYEGLEVGGGGLRDRVGQLKEALRGRPIKMSAVCSGYQGVLCSDKPELRRKAVDTMKDILTAAAELGCTGVICVPAFNGQTRLTERQARDLMVPFTRWDKRGPDWKPEPTILTELGEHAVKVGSRVLLEPLNRAECYILRQLADAAAICKDSGSPGICMMGDFWHMTWEETSDLGAFVSGGDYLHHVHIASRKTRNAPGEDEGDSYVLGFKGLKWIGYQDYVSLECGVKGNRDEVLPAVVKLLKEQWEQA